MPRESFEERIVLDDLESRNNVEFRTERVVEIEDGVEGLVHVSEMDWTNKNVNPSKMVHIGQEVEVMVLDIDEERRRISLGMKQCHPNPWEEFSATHNKGDHVKGTIKSITDFGIFIGLDGAIDGLIHLSDISWHDTGEEAVRNYKKGQEIEAAKLPDSTTGEIFYQLTLEPAAAERLTTFVETEPGGYICMVMDSYVLNCSVMYHQAGNSIEILPGLSSGTGISSRLRPRWRAHSSMMPAYETWSAPATSRVM